MVLLELKEAYERRGESLSGIHRLLHALGMTQMDLADALGMKHRNQINMYIKGRIKFTLNVARKIQRYAEGRGVHISLEELYEDQLNFPNEIKAAKRCQELAKAKGFELSLDEIFADDEGDDDGS